MKRWRSVAKMEKDVRPYWFRNPAIIKLEFSTIAQASSAWASLVSDGAYCVAFDMRGIITVAVEQ